MMSSKKNFVAPMKAYLQIHTHLRFYVFRLFHLNSEFSFYFKFIYYFFINFAASKSDDADNYAAPPAPLREVNKLFSSITCFLKSASTFLSSSSSSSVLRNKSTEPSIIGQ